jgi:hypothetical protein
VTEFDFAGKDFAVTWLPAESWIDGKVEEYWQFGILARWPGNNRRPRRELRQHAIVALAKAETAIRRAK